MYSTLVDFGFGLAVRKYTAKGLWKVEPDRYNRIASTLYQANWALVLPLLVATAVAIWHAPTIFRLQDAAPEMVRIARWGLLIFGIGNAVNFPITLFGNMIVGLQLQYLQNSIYAVLKMVEFILVCIIFHIGMANDTAFYALLTVVVLIPVMGNVLVGVMVYRNIPGLRLTCRFDLSAFKEVFAFSGWVYLGAIAHLVIGTVSPIMVGAFCGLTVAGVFQVGRKFPQLMSQLTAPYQENASPLSARLWSHGRFRTLGKVLLGFMRWNAFIATALSALVCAMAPELIRFFFNVDMPDAIWVCRVFTIQVWLQLVASTVPQAAFLMVDRHRFHIVTSTGAAVLTVLFTIVALKLYPGSAIAVTIAGLVAVALLAFAAHFPMLSRITGMTYLHIFSRTVGVSLMVAVLAFAAARLGADAVGGSDFVRLAVGSMFGLGTFVPLGASLLFTRMEQDRFLSKIRSLVERRRL